MSTRSFTFVPGVHYHIYNRGNSKQTIFFDAYDYERFVSMLFVLNSTESFKMFFIRDPYEVDRKERLVSIGAYCLMPNHFHILLTPLTEESVSIFMKKVMTGYAMYFNNRYNRTGSLFEGRFKATLAIDDVYLKYMYAYIHLNPVKLIQPDWRKDGIEENGKVIAYLDAYRYSSYFDYVGKERKESRILNPDAFPEYFSTHEDFKKDIFNWFAQNKQVQNKQVGPV